MASDLNRARTEKYCHLRIRSHWISHLSVWAPVPSNLSHRHIGCGVVNREGLHKVRAAPVLSTAELPKSHEAHSLATMVTSALRREAGAATLSAHVDPGL